MKRNYFTPIDKRILSFSLNILCFIIQFFLNELLKLPRWGLKNVFAGLVFLVLALAIYSLYPLSQQPLYLETEKHYLLQSISLINGSDIYKFFSSSLYGVFLLPITSLLYLKNMSLNNPSGVDPFPLSMLEDYFCGVRIFNLIISLIFLILLYVLLSKLYSRKTGILACLILLIFPPFQQSAALAIPQVAFITLLLIAGYWLNLFLSSKKLKHFYLFTIMMGLVSATLGRGIWIYFFIFLFCAWRLSKSGTQNWIRGIGLALSLFGITVVLSTFYLGFDLPLRIEHLTWPITERTAAWELMFSRQFVFLNTPFVVLIVLFIATLLLAILNFNRSENLMASAAVLATLPFVPTLTYFQEDWLPVGFALSILGAVWITNLLDKIKNPFTQRTLLTFFIAGLLGVFYGAAKGSTAIQARMIKPSLMELDFDPGEWHSPLLLGNPTNYQGSYWQTHVSHDLWVDETLNRLWPNFTWVSVKKEPLEMTFISPRISLNQISFYVKSNSNQKIKWFLYDDRKILLKEGIFELARNQPTDFVIDLSSISFKKRSLYRVKIDSENELSLASYRDNLHRDRVSYLGGEILAYDLFAKLDY